jgi:hypothetical protein
MKNIFYKYYPFWLGIIACVTLIGVGAKHGGWSFIVIAAFITGHCQLTKFH